MESTSCSSRLKTEILIIYSKTKTFDLTRSLFSGEHPLERNWSRWSFFVCCVPSRWSTGCPPSRLSLTASWSPSRMSSTSSLSTFSFNSYLLWLVYNYSMESFLPVMTKANTKQKNVSKYFYCYTCTGSISSSWYASLILDSTHNRKTKNVKN